MSRYSKCRINSMIRSGLILAGGNHAWQTGKPLKPDMEDGILTAYEISQMNLSNTELGGPLRLRNWPGRHSG
ncbi:MAG: hypothetical protein R2778_11535 [Saprospiraceae bacterium]